MSDDNPTMGEAPAFGARRLLFAGTGALAVAHMPFWVNWLSFWYPKLEVRVAITRSAARFVSQAALAPLAGREVFLDAWADEPAPTAPHVELTEWADAVIVHPATYNFVTRFALGMADTPVLLALQCTKAPVVVAPALPPGGVDSPAYLRHVASLNERPNVAVVPPTPGASATTGRMDAAVATPLPEVVAVAEKLRIELGGAA
ncbi:flavoprotein [Nonomuraea phyllanthi]|uniref:flavoprotein n=1 Tax=Nonomuraea phyllanthi TaxID=2219224 RepID=UPI001D14B272|nr:flavoprotein [Nonomuraea phyllanthi]